MQEIKTSPTHPFTSENAGPVAGMTVREIFGIMRPATIWRILGAITVIAAGAFSLGNWMSVAKSRPSPSPIVDNDIASAGSLIVETVNGEYAMLGVLHIAEGRGMVFSPPGGRSRDAESPVETAVRETFEETGYSIKDATFIENAPAGNPNFRLTKARIDEAIPQKIYNLDGTVGIVWSNPFLIPEDDWRFPSQRDWVLEHYESIVNQRKAKEKAHRLTNDHPR